MFENFEEFLLDIKLCFNYSKVVFCLVNFCNCFGVVYGVVILFFFCIIEDFVLKVFILDFMFLMLIFKLVILFFVVLRFGIMLFK